CHFCGGGYGGGGYYSSGGYYRGGPVYYESGCRDSGDCGSCCGGEVVVSDGCGDCGSTDCGGCDGCGCDGCEGYEGQAATPSDVDSQMAAPEPPANEPEGTPSTVNHMPAEPAPSLPPQPLPSATDTEMHAMPPAEPTYEAPAETPAMEPTPPPAEQENDLFSEPAAEATPLPAEEPATPSETDDFFSAPAEEPATDAAPSTPAETPAAEPSSEPSDNDLFGPPAEEEKPTEEATPPADEKKADENDDLFGNTEAILEMPGGLASHSLRHWVDNTGSFSCEGRLIRVLDGKVQLRKASGRTTTVPLARLSQTDFEFVNRQASAQQAETIGKTAQVSAGWSN
ncbi:MAG: SHD1 domain-containing protein, partial [Pirellulales bacterium]